MMQAAKNNPGLKLLGRRIEAQVRSRGLRTGDRFATTEEMGLLLGVSGATAHRAMSLLVEKKLLVREHGRGTFVGTAAKAPPSVELKVVYILLPDDQREVASVELGNLIEAIRDHLGRVDVQLSLLPSENAADYVRTLITQSQQLGQFIGAIPISCPREVYRFLSEIGAPCVVLGSVYMDQMNLPSVDIDNEHAGQLLTEHLLHNGHRRIALISAGGGRPGDDAFYDGVSNAMTHAQLPHNALVVRTFPHYFDAFRAQVDQLLASADRPTGIICRGSRLVRVVKAALAAAHLSSPADVELVFQTQSRRSRSTMPYAHVRPKRSFKEIAGELAAMLNALKECQFLSQTRIIVPVELVEASDTRNGA
jgi:DNA-binding LacI/PurR family transcriptional regulator